MWRPIVCFRSKFRSFLYAKFSVLLELQFEEALQRLPNVEAREITLRVKENKSVQKVYPGGA